MQQTRKAGLSSRWKKKGESGCFPGESNMKEKLTPKFIAQAAMIAAVYVVLTVVFAPISFSEVQVRISEALCVLPFFTPAAVPGLFVGCLLANILGGAILPDIIFGSIATLIGAVGTYLLRRQKWFAPVTPILSNTVIVPLVLRFGYGVTLPMPLLFLSIFAGEFLSCGVLGMALLFVLSRYRGRIFDTVF